VRWQVSSGLFASASLFMFTGLDSPFSICLLDIQCVNAFRLLQSPWVAAWSIPENAGDAVHPRRTPAAARVELGFSAFEGVPCFSRRAVRRESPLRQTQT